MTAHNESFHRSRESRTIDPSVLDKVSGFSLDKGMNALDLLKHYQHLGFQATHVARAAEIIAQMKKDEAIIILSMTSNMISSGLRELIAQIVKNKLVAAIITTTGAVEEDIMKCRGSFTLGDFEVDDKEVKQNKLNRIGNILVKDDQYCDLEDFHMKFLEKSYAQKKMWCPSEYINALGAELSDQNSWLYWATKNNIPVFCPGFTDGALGDHFFFFNERKPEKFVMDTAADVTKLFKIVLDAKKLGGVFLGAGIAKHHLIGAAIIRNGLDYAVYIQTGTQYDGSLSGAQPKEAVSWNKLKEQRNAVCIEADATLVFPLLALSWLHA